MLQNTAQNFPKNRAIFWEDSSQSRFLSWSEYISRISKTAGLLTYLGLGVGDRFGLVSRNIPYAGELINAGYWSGAIPVPINYRLSPLEIMQVIDDSNCTIFFVEEIFLELIAQAKHPSVNIIVISDNYNSKSQTGKYSIIDSLRDQVEAVRPASVSDDDDAIWLFTGGTTARGKGVRLSHRNIISNALQITNLMRPDEKDIYLHISPMFHSTDLKSTVVTMFGGAHVYLPAYSTELVLDAIEEKKVTILSLVPTTLIRFLKEANFIGRDLSSLRLISYGTSPIDNNWLRLALEKLPQVEFHQCYGLTETSPYLSILDGKDHKKALEKSPQLLLSAGKILPATQMRIVNDDGFDVPVGEAGELIVRGPQVSKGYINAPEEMAKSFVRGWFYTGDIAQIDEEGYLYIRDRKKEMVKTGGENVYTREVEIILLKHPKIMEVAVIGIPDHDYGESLLAVIVPKASIHHADPELSSEFLVTFCREYLGGYKIPRKYLIVDELPRTALGKIKKTTLKELFVKGDEMKKVKKNLVKKSSNLIIVMCLTFLSWLLMHSAQAQAQATWPNRPIKIIVPYAAGGSTDILARRLSIKLGEELNQSVVVENRGGANGSIGATSFAKAALDDHSFMVLTYVQLAINPYMYKSKLGHNPDTDLAPVGLIGETPNAIVVTPSLPVNSLQGLISYGKANPGKLTYSSAGIGSTGHLLNELIANQIGLDLVHVPYRGNGPAMQALVAGEVQFNTDNMPQLLPQIKSGRVKAVAVTSPKRWFQLPDVPTVSESGYPGLTTMVWFAMVAQSKCPPAVIKKMNATLNTLLAKPDVITMLRDISLEPMGGTPDEMKAAINVEKQRWKKVIEMSGVSSE